MSFILDALKKSESDRLQRDTPGYSHVPDKGNEKSASQWIWIVVVLITINVVVLTIIFLKPEGTPAVADSAVPAETIATTPPVTAAARSEPVAERTIQQPDNRPNQAQVQRELPAAPRPTVQQPATSVRQDPAPAIAQPSEAVAQSDVIQTYATFSDLQVQGVLNLPDLHLDIHVFSELRDDRFVFVNMSKYKEHSNLDEGPEVVEITPEGVVLNHRGMTFLLPRE
jgi:general secretion pathway protein B